MLFHSSPRVFGDGLARARTALSFLRRFAVIVAVGVSALVLPAPTVQVFGQGQQKPGQTELSASQRLNVMRSKLDSIRRSLDSAIAGMNAPEDKKANPDDPRERLRGLGKEANSLLNEVNDLTAKQDKSERYDTSRLDGLETIIAELNARVQTALQETASARTDQGTTSAYRGKKPKKSLLGRLNIFNRGGGDDKYAELTSTVAPGRDRVLFLDATREVRKGGYEVGRLLFNTIITTYPDSPYLALSKLAIADSFYLEGGTSSLIQAGQAYQDWLTFFPTDPLAEAAMLKVAESEMRQMGLSDRDISHARKAEQRLKVLLQQYPQTKLRPTVETRLREVQDNLAMHSLQVARFYYDSRYKPRRVGLKGAQDRLREIVEKYPNFCHMDEVLYRYATTYQEEEEPDQAAKYYQQLVRDHPNSTYVEKASEQLNLIGAPIPEPDPIKKNLPPCEKAGFMQNIMQQISGSANVATDQDGILITKHGEGQDLIDIAIANNGELPQPVTQRAPRPPANQSTPAPQPPEATPDKKKIGISIQPTPNGPQPDRINPAVPSTPAGQPPKKPEPTPTPSARPAANF